MTLSAQVINTGQNGIVGKTLDVKDKLFFFCNKYRSFKSLIKFIHCPTYFCFNLKKFSHIIFSSDYRIFQVLFLGKDFRGENASFFLMQHH